LFGRGAIRRTNPNLDQFWATKHPELIPLAEWVRYACTQRICQDLKRIGKSGNFFSYRKQAMTCQR
jgi:hypothetical protein